MREIPSDVFPLNSLGKLYGVCGKKLWKEILENSMIPVFSCYLGFMLVYNF